MAHERPPRIALAIRGMFADSTDLAYIVKMGVTVGLRQPAQHIPANRPRYKIYCADHQIFRVNPFEFFSCTPTRHMTGLALIHQSPQHFLGLTYVGAVNSHWLNFRCKHQRMIQNYKPHIMPIPTVIVLWEITALWTGNQLSDWMYLCSRSKLSQTVSPRNDSHYFIISERNRVS